MQIEPAQPADAPAMAELRRRMGYRRTALRTTLRRRWSSTTVQPSWGVPPSNATASTPYYARWRSMRTCADRAGGNGSPTRRWILPELLVYARCIC